MTIEQVATALECSESKISRIETSRVTATPRDVRDMLAIYDVKGSEHDALMRMAREARQKAWWHEFRALRTATFVGLETEARAMQMYSVQLVPGILQTERYARAVMSAVLPKANPDEIDRRIQLRMDRQTRRLNQDDPLILWSVIDEAALRRPVGEAGVMREQLEFLAEAADRPTVTIQVLPFSAGEHAGMEGDFTIIEFPEPTDPTVIFLETNAQDLYLEDPEVTRAYSLRFDYLKAAALTPAASKQFFVQTAKEL